METYSNGKLLQAARTASSGCQSIRVQPVTTSGEKGAHGFYPDHSEIQTGFVPIGPGLKKGFIIPKMKMIDITPFIVYITGIAFPVVEGKMHGELLSK